MKPAAEHLHLLLEGRTKAITKTTTYSEVRDIVRQIQSHSYYVPPPASPTPPEEPAEQVHKILFIEFIDYWFKSYLSL